MRRSNCAFAVGQLFVFGRFASAYSEEPKVELQFHLRATTNSSTYTRSTCNAHTTIYIRTFK